MDEHHLHRPLLVPSASATSAAQSPPPDDINGPPVSNSGLALRVLLVISVALISTWANHEASKGFAITVTNDVKDTLVGEKFSLFYESNDEATRLVQLASDFAVHVLYPDPNGVPQKLIGQVDIRLGDWNLTRDHVVGAEPVGEKNNYVISISPQIMEFRDFRYRIRRVIQRGMAEILLFNLQNGAPKTTLEGMVEYISNLAGFGPGKRVLKLRDLSGKCWEDEDSEVVAKFLGYCEGKSEGFIGRLSQAMRDTKWDEETVNRALGMPAKLLCESFRSSVVKVRI